MSQDHASIIFENVGKPLSQENEEKVRLAREKGKAVSQENSEYLLGGGIEKVLRSAQTRSREYRANITPREQTPLIASDIPDEGFTREVEQIVITPAIAAAKRARELLDRLREAKKNGQDEEVKRLQQEHEEALTVANDALKKGKSERSSKIFNSLLRIS